MKNNINLSTIDVKKATRAELELAYETLRKVSAMKTELIEHMEFKKQANARIK